MAEYVRALRTTIANYLSARADAYSETNTLLNEFISRGRVFFNESGTSLEWKAITALTSNRGGWRDMDETAFSRENPYITASLDWKGYKVYGAVSQWEKWMNRGPQAIFKVATTEIERMASDMEQSIEDMLYSTTGSDAKLYDGLATFLTANTGSYAGISQSTVSAWACQAVDCSASSKTWSSDAEEHIVRGQLAASRGDMGKASTPDLVVMTRTLFYRFHDLIKERERYGTEDDLKGGKKKMSWRGLELIWNDSNTANEAYILTMDKLSLHMLTSKIYEYFTEQRYSPLADVHLLVNAGNMKCKSPRYHCRLHGAST